VPESHRIFFTVEPEFVDQVMRGATGWSSHCVSRSQRSA
jgi:hypothetical protein